ncbi:GntR family transcriptional regulator [Spirillospora sp. NPDC127200]
MAITPPRYAQVADVLRKRIKDGVYEPGARLPSQAELRQEFDISVPTAKSAIAQLVSEGLVVAQQGRGVFVRESRELLRFTGARYSEPGPPNLREEHASDVELLVDAERRQVEASPEVAARLGIDPGDMCSEVVYTWNLDTEPVMVSTQWEPLALTKGTPIELPASGKKGEPDVITRFRSIGIEVRRVREDIRTRMPTPDEAHALKIPNGVPVFVIHRTHLADVPVETADIVLRGDSFVVRNEQDVPNA